MMLPLGIVISADGASAIGSLNRVAERLQNIGQNPARIATGGMRAFGIEANGTLEKLQSGFTSAENSWYKLGGALGLPLELTGLLGAVTGVRSLKDALIGSNAELETSKIRMSAMLKDFNDTDRTAGMKGTSVMDSMIKYSMATPFKIGQLVEAGTTLSSLTKSPDAVVQMTKQAAKLAALKGTTDVGWAAQSLLSAMQGNTASLRESFGINVSEDSLQTMSATMGYSPNSPQGRYAVLQRLIDQKAGKGDGIVRKLAESGIGATSTLQDELTMPFTQAATKGYDTGVKALVRFNDAYLKFSQTDAFKKMQTMLSDKFLSIGNQFAGFLDKISGGLEKIPALVEKWTPIISKFAKVGAVVIGVNVAAIALRATVGGAVMVFTTAMRVLSPLVSLVTNPLLVAGLLALSAAMWPTVKSMDVGGKSLDMWLTTVEKWAGTTDWAGMFAKPINAIKKLLDGAYLKGNKLDFSGLFNDAFGSDSLLGRLGQNVMKPILDGMKTAIENAFPQLIPAFGKFSTAFMKVFDEVKPYLPIIGKVALGLGAITVAGRALGVASPLLSLASAGLRGVGAALGIMEAIIASPLLITGIAILTTAMYPLVKNLEIGGKSIDGWLSKFGKDSASVDWTSIFSKPLAALKGGLEGVEGSVSGSWDASKWWKSLVAPDSLLGRIGSIITPIMQGIGGAITKNFPALGEFLSKFSNVGETLGNVWKIIGDVFFPFLNGLKTTALPGLKVIGGALLGLVGFAWEGISGVIKWIAWLVGTDQAKSFLTLLGQAVGRTLAIIGQVIEWIPKAIAGVQSWWASFSSGVNALDTAFNKFFKGVQERWDTFKSDWRTGIQIMASLFMTAWTPISHFFSSMWDGFKNVGGWIKDIAAGIGGWFSGIFDSMPEPLKKILNYIIGGTDQGTATPTVSPTSPLYVPTGIPVASPVSIPISPFLPKPLPYPATPILTIPAVGPLDPFGPAKPNYPTSQFPGSPASDFGGGGTANQMADGGNHFDLSGLSVPVTIYSQGGTALDNAALLHLVSESLGPMIAAKIQAALSGTKVG
jgi:hypothetical protein